MDNLKFNFFGAIINNIDIEILDHGRLYGDTSWRYFNVNSPFNRLYFVIDGNGYIENSRERVELQKGHVYLIPVNTTYDYICESHIEKFYIHFRMEFLSGQDVFELASSCLHKAYDVRLVNDLIEKVKSERLDDIISCKAYLFSEISQFLRACLGQDQLHIYTALKYQNVYKYIKEQCFAGLTVKEIAQSVGEHPDRLSRNFKADTGETLKSYISKKLIQSATEKLLLTDLSIKEIAFELKFTDEFYFSRFFKKGTGMSPKSYRLKNRII